MGITGLKSSFLVHSNTNRVGVFPGERYTCQINDEREINEGIVQKERQIVVALVDFLSHESFCSGFLNATDHISCDQSSTTECLGFLSHG